MKQRDIISELLLRIKPETKAKVKYQMDILMNANKLATCMASGAFESETNLDIQHEYSIFWRNDLEEIYELTIKRQ